MILELVFFYIVFEFLLIPFYFIIVLNSSKQYLRNVNQVNTKMNAFFLLFFYMLFLNIATSLISVFLNTCLPLILFFFFLLLICFFLFFYKIMLEYFFIFNYFFLFSFLLFLYFFNSFFSSDLTLLVHVMR